MARFVYSARRLATLPFIVSWPRSFAPGHPTKTGDGRGDPATYRPGSGEWRIWWSGLNYAASNPVVWGVSTDIPVAADYDGDGKTDLAVYRPSTGRWRVLLSSTNMQTTLDIQWGDAGSRPMPIDFDNDGRADLALSRFGGLDILLSGSNYTTSMTVR